MRNLNLICALNHTLINLCFIASKDLHHSLKLLTGLRDEEKLAISKGLQARWLNQPHSSLSLIISTADESCRQRTSVGSLRFFPNPSVSPASGLSALAHSPCYCTTQLLMHQAPWWDRPTDVAFDLPMVPPCQRESKKMYYCTAVTSETRIHKLSVWCVNNIVPHMRRRSIAWQSVWPCLSSASLHALQHCPSTCCSLKCNSPPEIISSKSALCPTADDAMPSTLSLSCHLAHCSGEWLMFASMSAGARRHIPSTTLAVWAVSSRAASDTSQQLAAPVLLKASRLSVAIGSGRRGHGRSAVKGPEAQRLLEIRQTHFRWPTDARTRVPRPSNRPRFVVFVCADQPSLIVMATQMT